MRFCTRMLLDRTRRILTETQAAIVKANRPKRCRHQFTPTQLRIAHEWHERQQNKKARTA